jgi:hypothetical protein
MKRKLLAVVAVVVMAAVAAVAYLGVNALTDGSASAGSGNGTEITVRYQYAVKFLCGLDSEKNGWFDTDINIHNPHHSRTVTFAKKGIELDYGGQVPTKPGDPVLDSLGPNYALRMNCEDIDGITEDGIGVPPNPSPPVGSASAVIEGFVVIESEKRLDVWAVYSGESFLAADPRSTTVDVLQVKPNRTYYKITVEPPPPA